MVKQLSKFVIKVKRAPSSSVDVYPALCKVEKCKKMEGHIGGKAPGR